MAYVGSVFPIPLGELALRTDAPMTSIPPNAAIIANNVDFEKSKILKSKGAAKFNETVLDSGVVAGTDWWPTPSIQNMIVGLENGKVSKAPGSSSTGTFTTVHTLASTPIDNSAMFVSGGNETAGAAKKLFYFTGSNQVVVGSGDFSSMSTISGPSVDWSAGNYPTGGLIFYGYMVAWGSNSRKHNLYFSTLASHEDFAGGDIVSIFPGEGDIISGAIVYKGVLFIFKKPLGVYAIVPTGFFDPGDPTTFQVQKFSDAFGIASPASAIQVLDDLWAANNTGSITSLQATDAFGDVKTGDVLALNQVEEYIKDQFDNEGISLTQAVYYSEKKRAMFTAMSEGGSVQDRILALDVARQIPRIRIYTAFEPNCLFMRRDADLIQRPVYGSLDGHVYLMEQDSRNVGGEPFLGEFQTPYMDFSAMDGRLASANKLFDFLEVQYVAQGNWSFLIDISIDGRFSETLTINQNVGAVLDSFELDEDRLGGEPYPVPIRIPIHGSGRTISFRIYNANLDQYFLVEKLVVCFRISGEQQSVAAAVS